MVIASLAIARHSELAGLTVAEIEQRFDVRVLEAGGAWRPPAEAPVEPGELVALAPRQRIAALARAA
jgi:hypothetical protein